MDTQARTNQGGSVVNFLLVGVVLIALVIGGIYFANQRSSQAGKEQPEPSVAVSPSASPSSPGSSSVSPSPSSTATPSPSVSPSTKPSPSTSPAPTDVPTTGVMPATGPTDTMQTLLPIALLVAVAVAYVESRRTRAQSTS